MRFYKLSSYPPSLYWEEAALGYDAYSLKFGSNSFMNTLMRDNKELRHAFTEDAINQFEFETGVYEVEEEGGW